MVVTRNGKPTDVPAANSLPLAKQVARFAQCEEGALNIEWTAIVALIVGLSLGVTLAVAQQTMWVNQLTAAKIASVIDD